MGQLSNTTGLLLSYNKDWSSRWYQDKTYSSLVHEDLAIKTYISTLLINNNIIHSKTIIKRIKEYIEIYVNVYDENKSIKLDESLVNTIKSGLTSYTKNNVILHLKTVKVLDAQIIASIVRQKLITRQTFQLIFTTILNKIKKSSRIKGVKIQCSGRPNGNDMSMIQWSKHGSIPTHSYNKKIDYFYTDVHTKYGLCGIKIWVYYI